MSLIAKESFFRASRFLKDKKQIFSLSSLSAKTANYLRFKNTGLVFALVLILIPRNSFAKPEVLKEIDSDYAWNQEYRVVPKNAVEVSSETGYKWPGRNNTAVRGSFDFLGLVEFGLTDHISILHGESMETVNRHAPSNTNSVGDNDGEKGTKYSGFLFEGKYRIGDKGKYLVDPLLSLSFSKDPRRANSSSELESRLVLSKDIRKLNLTLNQVLTCELEGGGGIVPSFDFGTNYLFLKGLRMGFEVQGDYWNSLTHKNELAGGPTVGYEYNNFWVVLGALFRFNEHTDNVVTRLIVGYLFD